MVAIVDYGVGNLFSLRCSLNAIGADVIVTGDANEIEKADRVARCGRVSRRRTKAARHRT